jgi:type III secretion protein V
MADVAPAERPGFLAILRAGDVRGLLGRYSDVGLAALVMSIVAMMIVPLPTFLLDLLICLNIAIAVTLLLIAMYVNEALKIATFPTLLLITTLFRLALEVSATRLILLEADGGEVIEAFGKFVVSGNLVVGAVIFLILTMIQFIVIAKGSERVAEVGARFTLDAMPGKQMSIDAELRAGHIDHLEARRRRAALARESQFFGAMDGAMKFVKGDAIAGLVVLAVNIVGGLVIGVMQRGMELGAAARLYTVLTIGEGLVAQIPALIISTAAGVIVTRVSSDEEGGHLGKDIGNQILAQPKALAIGAALLFLLALVPGLPGVPFFILAVILGVVARKLLRDPAPATTAPGAAKTEQSPNAAGAKGDPQPLLAPLSLELSPALSRAMAPGGRGRLMDELIPAACARLFAEAGIPLPHVKLRANVQTLPEHGYAFRINEVVMAHAEVHLGAALVLTEPHRLAELGLEGQPGLAPEGGPATWLGPGDKEGARLAGLPVQEADEVIAAHVLAVLRRFGHELVGIQESQILLEALERTHPALVREVVPKIVSPVLLTDVLRRLAEEGVSLRNLRLILETLAQWAPSERDPVALTEQVRAALRRPITAKLADASGKLAVILVDPMIEETIRESIHRTPGGSYLALEPQLSRDIVRAAANVVGAPRPGTRPVVLTNANIRRYLSRLLEPELPHVTVLSYPELAPDVQLQPVGRIAPGG